MYRHGREKTRVTSIHCEQGWGQVYLIVLKYISSAFQLLEVHVQAYILIMKLYLSQVQVLFFCI